MAIQCPNRAFLSIWDAIRTDQSWSNIINQKNKIKGLFSFPMEAIAQAHAISVVRIRRERDSGL
jgi:hypothetical protein